MGDRNDDALTSWPEIDESRCEGCGECLPKCPTGALVLINGRVAVKPIASCLYCADCEAACPRGVIRCPYSVVFAEDN